MAGVVYYIKIYPYPLNNIIITPETGSGVISDKGTYYETDILGKGTITISADGYQSQTVDITEDTTITLVANTQYFSKFSDGTNTYVVKDAEAREAIDNLATVATSGSYNDLSNKPDLDAKANDSAVVHKTGNESISGIKTFADNVVIEKVDPKYFTKNKAMTRGTYNSSQGENKIVNQDKNGKLLSEMRTYVEKSDSATTLCLAAVTEDSNGSQIYKTMFRGTIRKNNTSEVSLTYVNDVYAPHPASPQDSSNRIATTAWVNTKISAFSSVPNYSAGFTVNADFTAAYNGFLKVYISSNYPTINITVNGVQVVYFRLDHHYTDQVTYLIPIAKGDVVTLNGSSTGGLSAVFFPVKGA